MLPDVAPPALDAFPAARPFIPYCPPPPLALTEDDVLALNDLDAGWASLRGPLAKPGENTALVQSGGKHDPPPPKRPPRRGLPVRDTAEALSIPRLAFIALCEHHDVLALRPYAGRQRRRLVTTAAERNGLGWNVIPPTSATTRRHGVPRFWPFAVFDPKRLDDLAQVLGWSDILAAVAGASTREARRDYLLTRHAHLPDGIIADLSGYARSAIQKARSRVLLAPTLGRQD